MEAGGRGGRDQGVMRTGYLWSLMINHVLLLMLESLRLCDSEGLSQADAGQQMGVSRGTVQRLVTSGRKKIIDAILNSQALVIQVDGEGFE